MDEKKISRVYAEAIYDVAKKKDQVFEVLEILDVLVNHIKLDEEFKKFLDYPIISKEDKKTLINKMYKDVKGDCLEILDYLIDKNRLSHIEGIRDEYLDMYNDAHNQLVVKAIFPKEISENQRKRLIEKLEKMKNKKIILEVEVDPSLIAGGIIKIGDEIIDGSVKSQIRELKNKF